jgi:hypothetical protein
VLALDIALYCYYRIRSGRRSKIVMPRGSRDFRENEPLAMTQFPSFSPVYRFVEYRGEPEENLGAPERSPIEGRGERSTVDFVRSDEKSIPELALGREDRD